MEIVLEEHEEDVPDSPSIKQWLTKGKVVLAELIGDKAILGAMHSNEEDTNTAYERVLNHEDIWNDAVEIIGRGYADERRHKIWLEVYPEDEE
ncbi:MAG: hypothetical protein JSS34_03825 [Proteobacteria bacterium]|nr:hypothetical protein [Pseudomonadota bacterium]